MFTGEKKKTYQKMYMRKRREKMRSNTPVKTEAFEAKTCVEKTDVCEPIILNVPMVDADGNLIYEEN